jgi:hypothetical protein
MKNRVLFDAFVPYAKPVLVVSVMTSGAFERFMVRSCETF